jgi:hypothetical protein
VSVNPEAAKPSDLVWGGPAIAKILNVSPRKAFGLLEAGHISDAKKIGGRWCVSRRRLLEQFGVAE